MKYSIIGLIFILSYFQSQATSDSSTVKLKGFAFDANNRGRRLDDLMIINSRSSQGTFGMADGTFSIDIFKSDTVIIASTGYEFIRICFTDSTYKPVYEINFPLIKLNVTLSEVNIFSPRDLKSIYNDIQKLGYNKKDFELSGVD